MFLAPSRFAAPLRVSLTGSRAASSPCSPRPSLRVRASLLAFQALNLFAHLTVRLRPRSGHARPFLGGHARAGDMGYWRETMDSTPFAHFRRGVFLLPIALGFFATGVHAAAKPAFGQKAYFQITSGSSVSVTLRRTPVCARRIPSTWVSATGSGSSRQ